jgi:polysaccharide biosynthesis PFTS motif protein
MYIHSEPRFENFVYFVGLTKNNTPQALDNEHSYDIMSWYCQCSHRVQKINALCHDVKGLHPCTVAGIPVLSMPLGIPSFAKLSTLMRYIGWSLIAISFCLIDLLRGRWWHALLLEEASLSKAVELQSPEVLARDYLFHNSNWTYRPLWTYEAAAKGSRITFYFYSTTSGDSFKRTNGVYPPPYFGYLMMTWPHYLVWNNHQAKAIRGLVGQEVNVSVVGPIWFLAGSIKLPALSSKAIAVFDVQPVRDSFYQIFGIDFDYYTPITAIQFLSDIEKTLARCGCQFILKRKRNIGRLTHPKYRHFIKKLAEQSDFISIDPEVSAVQLIKNCVAVISMPFTSTAILAKELGKPSVYYDPHGLIQKDDRGAHGIEILCGREELSAWAATIAH